LNSFFRISGALPRAGTSLLSRPPKRGKQPHANKGGNVKAKVKRIGRYWIEKALLDEGYGPEDIFEGREPMMELPELFDPNRRRASRWLSCPRCSERSQVGSGRPSCVHCGWNELEDEELMPCAA